MQKNEKISEKIPFENAQNYMRLQNLLSSIALPLLRKTFINNWTAKYQSEWINCEGHGTKFIDDIGATLFKDARKIQKNLLKSGDIDKWDLSLVIDALKCFQEHAKVNAKMSKEHNKRFMTLKEIRNQLSHHGGIEIDNEIFEKMWKSASEVLISLGVLPGDLDKAKVASVQEKKANIEKALKLKDEGNLYVKNNNYVRAVEKYSEAIYQPGLPSKELAILYSNRSLAYLKQSHYYGAKEDAKGAILLNPNWWRGFGRLGHAYLSVEKYKQALENFEEAIRLDADCKLQNERHHCRHMLAKISREEHLDPINHATTFNELGSQLKDMQEKSPFLANAIAKMTGGRSIPLGMCAEGHKYLQGQGVPQSYEMAAHWYSKAAAKGNAEGYYNLALLTKEGKGVKLNVPESIRLMELAASQDICYEMDGFKMPNIGVVEAEHSLGLSYDEGVGVPQNSRKALEWYTRAIKHGSGVSANNVGRMYCNGKGVPQSRAKALDYYKLASALKVVRAMENVADVYLQLLDKANAHKWFQYAIKKGSLALQASKQVFLFLVGKELENPIEEDVFELELIEEVKKGPLKHLFLEGQPLLVEELLKTIVPTMEVDDSIGATSRKSLGLTDPYRVGIITQHRAELRKLRYGKHDYVKGEANLLPKPVVDLFTLKPIHFTNMDTTKDHIYEGFAIKLTLIEDAITGKPSINQIVEDENGDAQRIFIYNFPQNKETQNSVGFGCKITIVNPYFRLAKDGRPMIRVDDISLMFLHSNATNKKRCRYCGKENDLTVPCRKCKRSFYCSKLCLKKDLTELNHNDVCLKRL